MKEGENNAGSNLQNSSNPYDSVGIVHNLILDAFIERRDSLYEVCDSTEFSSKFSQVMAQSICEIGYYTPTPCEADLQQQVVSFIGDAYVFDYEDLLAEVFEGEEAVNFSDDLVALLVDTSQYELLVSNIVLWEAEVLESEAISENERTTLLILGSVARHSAGYWLYEFNDENSLWNYDWGCGGSVFHFSGKNNKGMQIQLFWKSLTELARLAYADSYGAAVGYANAGWLGAAVAASVFTGLQALGVEIAPF